jgi:hypothetical protein
LGDFNEIVPLSEKWGGAAISISQMAIFRDALEACNLGDWDIKDQSTLGVTKEVRVTSSRKDSIELLLHMTGAVIFWRWWLRFCC